MPNVQAVSEEQIQLATDLKAAALYMSAKKRRIVAVAMGCDDATVYRYVSGDPAVIKKLPFARLLLIEVRKAKGEEQPA